LIGAGKVRIDGRRRSSGHRRCRHGGPDVAAAGERSWVSRGAHKLIGALDAFGIG